MAEDSESLAPLLVDTSNSNIQDKPSSSPSAQVGLLQSLIWAAVLVISTASLNISLPMFAGGFPEDHFSGPYFVLVFTTACFVVFFGSCTLVSGLVLKPKSPVFLSRPFLSDLLLFLLIGSTSAINGILKVYASPVKRTSPILQALLSNTAFLWGIPATKLFLRTKRNYQFCQMFPVLAILFVVNGLAWSLLPSIIRIWRGEEHVFASTGGLVWAFIYLTAMAPSALTNVFQEKYLTQKENISRAQSMHDMLRMLFWSNLMQGLIFIMLFFVDIIPGFGFSSSAQAFFTNICFTFKCFFNSGACPNVWWKGLTFVLAYICTTIAAAELNRSSANFGLIASTLGSPLAALFWILLPHLSQDSTTPLWSVIPAMLLLIGGSVLWKKWEVAEKDRLSGRYQGP